MQLKMMVVDGLFGQYNHAVPFPLRDEDNPDPSLTLLCGENGVGKTTLLRMLNGFMTRNFTAFRVVPFESATLTFNDDTSISVKPTQRTVKNHQSKCLRVKYGTITVDLHPTRPGPLLRDEMPKVEAYRQQFETNTSGLSVSFISTSRLQELYAEQEAREQEKQQRDYLAEQHGADTMVYEEPMRRRRHADVLLADRIKRFIRDAQLNFRQYFTSRNTDLFPKIIESLTERSTSDYDPKGLVERMETVAKEDGLAAAYGLHQEPWNLDQLKKILQRRGKKAPDTHALTVANTYVEFLESRASERRLLLDRLQTFEASANSFLQGKSIRVNTREGLHIQTEQGGELIEARLSSGEYHLLYLLVVALTTQRRGTVMAIDEPEISMHLGWQRRLLPAILKCASMGQPQLVIATHSPDITAGFPEACVDLGGANK